MRMEPAMDLVADMARPHCLAVAARILFVVMAIAAWAAPGPVQSAGTAAASAETVVIVVRHAEKLVPADAGKSMADEDPPLTPAGTHLVIVELPAGTIGR